MKFSIVLPTYNVSKYIDRCLKSCVEQTCKDIEIIIVDDCGQDNSIDKAYKWSGKDTRIKVIHNEKNLGTFHARRVGVEAALGEYILFLDPDDEIELNTIEELSKMLSAKPDLIFYGTRPVPAPKTWQYHSEVPVINSSLNYESIIVEILKCKGLNLGTAGKAIKKNTLLKAYELLSIDLNKRLVCGEDVLLYSALLMVMETGASVSERLYIYHKNAASISFLSERQDIINNIDQLKNVLEIIKSLDLKDQTNQFIQKYIERRLLVNKIKLLNKVETKKTRVLKNYLQIVSITKSPREIIKFLIFLFSLGGKNL